MYKNLCCFQQSDSTHDIRSSARVESLKQGIMRIIHKRLVVFTALFSFWVMLSESIHTDNLLVGAITAFIVTMITWKPLRISRYISGKRQHPLGRLVYAIAFIPVFFHAILSSAIEVARHAFRHPLKISPGTIKFTSKLKGKFALVLLSNYISLTPGTLTLDLNETNGEIEIHCLDINNPDLRQDVEMIEKWLEMIFE